MKSPEREAMWIATGKVLDNWGELLGCKRKSWFFGLLFIEPDEKYRERLLYRFNRIYWWKE